MESRYKHIEIHVYCIPINPLPHMPILGSSNSAANKDMT